MNTTYKVQFIYGTLPTSTTVVTEEGLRRLETQPRTIIVSAEPYTPEIRYPTQDGCPECITNEYVPHFNCRCGYGRAHCTADLCY